MKSPFPGMDPFIEACNLWEDFHGRLIAEIERALNEVLPTRYITRFGERYYVESIDPTDEPQERRSFIADVAVDSTPVATPAVPAAPPASLAEITPGAIVIRGLISDEHRETFLEIRDLDRGRRLVTSIEILSPANKRPGEEGWEQYEAKRRPFLKGHANLVEIDLLRRGRRHLMAQQWPPFPCYALVLRREEAPDCHVWAADTLSPLPTIPVPLIPPDSDIPLALQPIVDAVYTRSRYVLDIDYRRPRRLVLTPEELTWLEQHLPPPANGVAPS